MTIPITTAQAVELQTSGGLVRGTHGKGISAFYGIPYAAAPIAGRRFRPPEPAEPWRGVRDCTTSGPICPQAVSGASSRLEQNEDCLHLNVWTAGPQAERPIIFYIHGGGFMSGHGSARITDGTELARRGAVVVAVNYRLHALGFLDLGEPHDPNAGLLDQVAALRWTRENARAFGGDPDRITVAGYSSGGNSAAMLMTMPAATGLFRRVAIHDGSPVVHLTRETTARIAADFLELVSIAPSDRTALERLPTEDLLGAVRTVIAIHRRMPPEDTSRKARPDRRKGTTWTPAEGPALPRAPLDAIRAGAAEGIDLLIGTNRDSMALLSDDMPPISSDAVAAYLGDHLDQRSLRTVLDVYRSELPAASDNDVLGAVMTDLLLAMPAMRFADVQASHHDRVWLYEFCGANPTTRKATHGTDTGLWFGNAPPGTAPGHPISELAIRMADALIAFAADGDPSTDALGRWRRYECGQRATMRLDALSQLELDPHRDRRELWADAVLP